MDSRDRGNERGSIKLYKCGEFLKDCHKILNESSLLNEFSYTLTSNGALIHVKLKWGGTNQIKNGKILFAQTTDITSLFRLIFSASGTHRLHWKIVSQWLEMM